jgi:hypothetical protein
MLTKKMEFFWKFQKEPKKMVSKIGIDDLIVKTSGVKDLNIFLCCVKEKYLNKKGVE